MDEKLQDGSEYAGDAQAAKKAALAEAYGARAVVLARMTGRYPPLSHLQDRVDRTAERGRALPRSTP